MPSETAVLMTGATGFVGSRVAAAYAASDCTLRCTVRETSDTRWIDDLRVQLVQADLRAPGGLAGVLEGVDLVVHVAGITAAAEEETFYEVNTEGTLELAKAASEAGVGRFVYMSSLAARGPDDADEEGDGPVSAYGMSKLAAEDRLRGFRDEMTVVVLRPGGVYGPRDTELLPLFRAASRGFLALPASDHLIQPVYVGDVARAAVLAGEAGEEFGPHPLVGRERCTWAEMADVVEEAVGRRVRRLRLPPAAFTAAGAVAEWVGGRLGGAPAFDRRRARDLASNQWTADPTAARRPLGWRPHVSLPEGLRRTVRWYRDQGWL